MRFRKPRAQNDDERILPLVNIVFLLLIFFMITGRLAVSDPFEIMPPRSVSEGQAETQETLVLIGADGRIALDGEVMDKDALKTRIAERMAADDAGPVRLKADGRADATRVVALMELLRDAGVERLKLLTVPGGG